jgi:hypothetical protein
MPRPIEALKLRVDMTENGTPTPPVPPVQTARRHRALVAILLGIALTTGLVSMFAVWLNRQALNAENGTEVSSKLLANDEIRSAVGTYLVDELFRSVDVAAQIRPALPPQAQGLAGPAAAGLKRLADDRAPKFLARPRVQDAWKKANFVARTELLRLLNGDKTGAVSAQNDAVVLDLQILVQQLATEVGLGQKLSAAQGQLQEKGVTIPPDAGQLVLVKSNQIGLAQDGAKAIKGLALWLTILTFALFALAVYLAVGWRRVAFRRVGWCLIGLGLLVLLARRFVGNQVIDGLVPNESVRPAAIAAWGIITQMLHDIAVAVVAYGTIVVVAAWLAGSTRLAVGARHALAPALRHEPGAVYGAVGFAYLLVLLWGPTPATRALWGIVIFALLIVLGVELLRRQTAREFPDAKRGETAARMRAWGAAAVARRRNRHSATPAAKTQVTGR